MLYKFTKDGVSFPAAQLGREELVIPELKEVTHRRIHLVVDGDDAWVPSKKEELTEDEDVRYGERLGDGVVEGFDETEGFEEVEGFEGVVEVEEVEEVEGVKEVEGDCPTSKPEISINEREQSCSSVGHSLMHSLTHSRTLSFIICLLNQSSDHTYIRVYQVRRQELAYPIFYGPPMIDKLEGFKGAEEVESDEEVEGAEGVEGDWPPFKPEINISKHFTGETEHSCSSVGHSHTHASTCHSLTHSLTH
jgi:hypothetical protein